MKTKSTSDSSYLVDHILDVLDVAFLLNTLLQVSLSQQHSPHLIATPIRAMISIPLKPRGKKGVLPGGRIGDVDKLFHCSQVLTLWGKIYFSSLDSQRISFQPFHLPLHLQAQFISLEYEILYLNEGIYIDTGWFRQFQTLGVLPSPT